MNEYLILIAAHDEKSLSIEEGQKCITDYGKWASELGEKHVTGRRLAFTDGRLLPSKKEVVTDGPFVEAKELIAGIILVQAESLDHACELADACPLRAYFQLFVKETN
ncbi:MAG: YciI family protein [Bacteroidota bacterium]